MRRFYNFTMENVRKIVKIYAKLFVAYISETVDYICETVDYICETAIDERKKCKNRFLSGNV